MTCERCGAKSDPNSYDLFDYCAKCSKNLCPKCMAEGCCGKVPAESGNESDHGEDARADDNAVYDAMRSEEIREMNQRNMRD